MSLRDKRISINRMQSRKCSSGRQRGKMLSIHGILVPIVLAEAYLHMVHQTAWLARRFHAVKRGELKVPIIGVGPPNWNLEHLYRRVTDSIRRSGGIDNRRALHQLLSLLKYVSGDYKDPAP
jgi:hypothetical protein